ncbi:hypothetical protein BDB00DRAFT_613277 [Zychaea mexicana]|uniref:uncharacterized protein n=1 Tax=Zychaea mexicana TaxID=64656 RepID=UPI0022FE3140|nr:uncharacterized protein BDB00DRAFT_613277 [Zychaea mexicana]KAI9489452.1 hypothetical protein BDB00DRAFT_613277 [Zychaea mexicana]
MLAWQWALIALAIAAVVSSVAFTIYLLWRRRVWHNKQQIQATRCCPGPHDQRRRRRGMDFGADEVRKKDSDSAIGRVSPKFPSSFLLQQHRQNNTTTTPSTTSDSVFSAEDLEKAQHLVMMPLSAPPPRAGKKPKLCMPQQSKADIDCPMKSVSSSSATQQKRLAQKEDNGSSNVSKSESECNGSGVVDHDDGNVENYGDQTNILPNTAASVTSTTSATTTTPTPTKRSFVLTPFLESPTTTPTSGRSTAEHIVANAIISDSNMEPHYHHHHYSFPQQHHQNHQEHRQQYYHRRGSSATTTASSSNNLTASYSSSNGNIISSSKKQCSNNSSGCGSSPTLPPPSSSSVAMRNSTTTTTTSPLTTGQWRGPTPPWTLLGNDSSSNNKN